MIAIKPIQQADFAQLARIDKAWPQATMNAHANKKPFIGMVAQNAGEAVGFIIGNAFEDSAEIIQITIAINHRNKGYGQALLAKFIQVYVRKICTLEVDETNQIAIRLYQKAGFNTICRRKNYYTIDGDKRDALVMTLDSDRLAN